MIALLLAASISATAVPEAHCRYTFDEIEQMRRAVYERTMPPLDTSYNPEELDRKVEDFLRTLIIACVDPADIPHAPSVFYLTPAKPRPPPQPR